MKLRDCLLTDPTEGQFDLLPWGSVGLFEEGVGDLELIVPGDEQVPHELPVGLWAVDPKFPQVILDVPELFELACQADTGERFERPHAVCPGIGWQAIQEADDCFVEVNWMPAGHLQWVGETYGNLL